MSSLLQSSRISFLSTTPVVQIYCNSFFITSNPVITCLGEGVIGGSVAIKIDNYIYMRHIILISTLGFSIAVSVHVCVVGWGGVVYSTPTKLLGGIKIINHILRNHLYILTTLNVKITLKDVVMMIIYCC